MTTSSEADRLDPAAFDQLVARLDYPMFVVTVEAGGTQAGCLVGFATQASIDPARFLVCLSTANHTYAVARDAAHLAIHVLRADDVPTAHLFGELTGDDVDKFARCAWRKGPHGLPILDAAAAWFTGTVVDRHPFGDHVGFLVEPDAGEVRAGAHALLTFRNVTDLDAGHDA